MKRPCRADSGFTLTELMVVITLTGIIGSVVTAAATTGLHKQTQIEDRNDALAAVRTTFERVGRDIRSAAYLELAEDNVIKVCEMQASGAKTMTYSLVADGSKYDLVVDEDDATTCYATTSTPRARKVVLRNVVNPATSPVFNYTPTSTYSPPAAGGVTASTCVITGASPVQYDQKCVGTVTIHLLVYPSTLSAAMDVSDNGTEIRNAA